MSLFVEQTFSEMKFGNATNLLDSDKRPLSAASINKHRSEDKYRYLRPLIAQLKTKVPKSPYALSAF